jgi:hypothetical protein
LKLPEKPQKERILAEHGFPEVLPRTLLDCAPRSVTVLLLGAPEWLILCFFYKNMELSFIAHLLIEVNALKNLGYCAFLGTCYNDSS